MNIIKYIFVFVFLGSSATISAHPMHLTITNVEILDDSVKVSIRIFETDFNMAITDFCKQAMDTSDLNGCIQTYVDSNFKIYSKSTTVNLKLNEFSTDESSVTLYFDGLIELNELTITIENSLLKNLNGDQRNLLIISRNNKEEGLEFTATEIKKTITLVE